MGAFPDPPGRVLIGGAGGGREAFALAARGYEVVAFEPSADLARSMVQHPPAGISVEALIGRYEDLPSLTSAATGARVDLRLQGPLLWRSWAGPASHTFAHQPRASRRCREWAS